MEVPTEQVITLNGGTESSRSYSEVADQEMCGESWSSYVHYHIHKGFSLNYMKPGPRCPEGSRKLGFPDYVTMAQDGGKFVSLYEPRPESLTPVSTLSIAIYWL